MPDFKRFHTVYPWYGGLSADLLFWVAIDTLFLAMVKHLSTAEIVTLDTISMAASIIVQFPILLIIKKIGNTASVRLASFLVLGSACFLTFGTSFFAIAVGKVIYQIGFTFHPMINIILKSNLHAEGKDTQYIQYRTQATTIYSLATMIISFTASFLFNANAYLPMYLCIFFCVVCCVLSFFIEEFDTTAAPPSASVKAGLSFPLIVLTMMLLYGLYLTAVNLGQSDGKLLIQQEMQLHYNDETTTLLIGTMIAISRVIRVVSNIIFGRIYERVHDRVFVGFITLLPLSLVIVLLACSLNIPLTANFFITTFGYAILLLIRDPFTNYMQSLVLDRTDKEKQPAAMMVLDLSRKGIHLLASAGVMAIVNASSLFDAMLLLVGVALISEVLGGVLFVMIVRGSHNSTEASLRKMS